MPSATRLFVRSMLITVTAAVTLMFAVPGALAGGSPSTLVFAVQPTTTQVQTEMSPAVVVDVEDSMGHLITSFNGPVTLNYAPGTNVLNAPPPTGNTVYAVNGVATFSDLAFRAAGFGFELQASIWGRPVPRPSRSTLLHSLCTASRARSARPRRSVRSVPPDPRWPARRLRAMC